MTESSRGLRLSDAERQTAVDQLGEQFAVGRLTREEFDERSDAVWSAKTHGDLFPVFADLPAQAPRAVSVPSRGSPGSAGIVGTGLHRVRRLLVPLFVVLIVLTVITHLPLVLIAVGAWFFVGRRRWLDHHHGGWDRGWHGGATG
jgi:uncharacterized membrane protein